MEELMTPMIVTLAFYELPKKVQKVLKDHYVSSLTNESRIMIPGFGSDYDADYILILASPEEELDLSASSYKELDVKIASGIAAEKLQVIANGFGPAIWIANGGECSGFTDEEKKQLFYSCE